MAAGLMLEHVGKPEDAQRLKKAVIDTVQAKDRVTPDLGGTGNTMSIAEAIMDRL